MRVETKPIYKKWWFWVIIASVSLALIAAVILIVLNTTNNGYSRSFTMVGPSMEDTLYTGDKVTVSVKPDYSPTRGDIIVFKNPMWSAGRDEEYLLKRVVGLPGERVTVNDCLATVYNDSSPNGFNPYESFDINNKEVCVAGDGTDVTVPDNTVFVVGDHRDGSYSMDSRNGDGRASFGNIPLSNIVGAVVQVYPGQR
jgi:signal peptidase I